MYPAIIPYHRFLITLTTLFRFPTLAGLVTRPGYARCMLHAFVDESESNADYFFLSALIVKDEKLPDLNTALDDLIAQYAATTAVPNDAELHGHDMMQQTCDWEGLPLKLCSSVYLKAMGIINKYAEVLYIECIDRKTQAQRYRYVYNHRTVCIGYILERINEFAQSRRDTATVYLDDHYTAEEGRKEFVHYRQNGTFGYKRSKLQQIASMDFHNSREYRGLQAADLCTYIANRIHTQKDAHPKVVKLQNKLWGAVKDIRDQGRYRIWP